MQLKKNKVVELKTKQEIAFNKWARKNEDYKNIIAEANAAFKEYTPFALQRIFLNEGILAPYIAKMANMFYTIETFIRENDQAKLSRYKPYLMSQLEGINYSPRIVDADKRIFDSILVTYYHVIPKEQQAPIFKNEILSFDANPREAIRKYTEFIFSTSIFADKDMVKSLLNNPRLGILETDPMYKHLKAFYEHYEKTFKPKVDEFNEKTAIMGRAYIKGMMEMNKSSKFYPDANSSLRLTYGNVQSYAKYNYITTLDEMILKNIKFGVENPDEFSLPKRLIEIYEKKDFGQYATANGMVPIAFLSNNDITGGNSGSPVIDGNGNLIGTAFDGNWEAMSGNIAFNKELQRTINLDIRFTLFIIDKYAGATNLINEMKIIK